MTSGEQNGKIVDKKSKKIDKKWKYIYIVINCLVILIIGFGAFIYSIHPDLHDFRNSVYGLMVYFLILAGIILGVTLSRTINMPLLGKITVWAYGLLFILLSVFDFGRIELLFFFIYAVINFGVAIFLYKKYWRKHILYHLIGN